MTQLEDVLLTLAAFPQPGWEESETAQVLEPFSQFVSEVIAPAAGECDREGARFTDGRVHLPSSMVAAYRSYVDLGWNQLHLSQAAGGFGAPDAVSLMATQLLAAANASFQMLTGLVRGGADALVHLAPELAPRYLPLLTDGSALVTMALTEPGAGTDLGAIRTRAEKQPDGTWRISGEKIFISGGDQDMSETILHFVLARTHDTPGTRGLSLFLCPARRDDGTANALAVTRIEEKMGLHASPTCQMRFDGAEAYLLGEAGKGLAGMFIMMNHARLDVAAQGVAAASAAHEKALAYARTRMQGRTASGAPASLLDLPDIRRMLLTMDSLALGGRAMVAHTAGLLTSNPRLATFLTPIVKTFCTDMGSRAADLGIQVLGGYGYLAEYDIERIWRDSRVARLYEGANGALAAAFVKRELADPPARAAFVDAIATLARETPFEAGIGTGLAQWADCAQALAAHPRAPQAAEPVAHFTGLLHHAAALAHLAARHPDHPRLAAPARFALRSLSAEIDHAAARLRQMLEEDLPALS
ncbi:acyl-CoA dehydrogenase family protein [Pelagibacterium flavum]|uniref:Acyl-CoA dehydrogenase family protein n=1 Tax=Pelagibacterium flavum TaxID=2984530 RepID=A0ABY6IRV5_9HYPH|nr:acyl-CoA dehydrogenase family protein [Pelagibacterium sp. YIM 151497]UYQ73339.1 acyl-CoA dehydrogenase family protein [Pelagibacterium sp. YIM 151497]|tara:strand:+ start:2066 stop:3655 length:1590 start_codon:yes stop_codon:yes gene_type:complete